MTDEIARLLAQNAALKVAVFALMDLHQGDKGLLAAHIRILSEHLVAGYLNTQLSDVLLSEFQRESEALQKRAQEPPVPGLNRS